MPGAEVNTPAAVEARSIARAKAGRRRVIILFVVMVLLFLTLAYLLQLQQQQLKAYVRQQCIQRQINTNRTNQIWADLGKIEEKNTFIDNNIRQQRLSVYRNAKLDVPVCPS